MAVATTQVRALELTRRLVRHPSVTSTDGERELATLLDSMLEEIGHGALEHGLYAVEDDACGRTVAWALLRGAGPRTVVLMSHYDTVDTGDYGSLREWACEPDELRARMLLTSDQLEPLVVEHLRTPEEWMFGRGSVDMKSGIAAHLTALEELCSRVRGGEPLPGNVVFVCTPDEENESAGMLAAVQLLAGLKRDLGLELLGAINTDYTTPLHAGDDTRVIHTGTVGKALPSVYVRGLETHAGQPYHGFDANLLCAEIVRAISLRADLADSVGEDVAVPPVSLKVSDFKDRYDVQAPYEAYAYFNYLTFGLSADAVLESVMLETQAAMSSAVAHIYAGHARWRQRAGLPVPPPPPEVRTVSYAELLAAARAAGGEDRVAERLAGYNALLAGEGLDARVRSVQLVRELWDLSGLRGPAAVVYFSPPYYPHVRCDGDTPFLRAVRRVARDSGAVVRNYYPYISDASYLSLEHAGDISALTSNMPLWRDPGDRTGYSLPLDGIRSLKLDVVNIGVWGHGAHKPDERLHVPYSCGVVPRLVLETVLQTLEG